MSFTTILVAAGSGERLGAQRPKALVEVAGRPLVAHAAERVLAAGTDHLVVVAPADHLAEVLAVLPDAEVEVDVVAGGATRAASVRAGLSLVHEGATVVAVHDAARAFAPPDLVGRVVAAVTGDVVAAAPGVPVGDTLKRVDGDTVVGTVDRDALRAVQTPQVFRVDVLRRAHAGEGDATDDLALVESLVVEAVVTGRVVVVPGDPAATKVTWPHDLVVVPALAGVAP